MRPSLAPTVRLTVKIGVSLGLLAFLLSRISTAEMLRLVRTMDLGVAAIAVLVFLLSNTLGALQWHRLLVASGVELSYGRAFRFYFVGLFFNNFLPANIGGDAVKVYDITRIGTSVYQVVAVTLLDRLIGIFSLCLLAIAAVVGLMIFNPIESLWLYLIIFAGCLMLPMLFYVVGPMGKVLRWLVSRVRTLALDERGAHVLDHMGRFKGRRTFVLRLVLLSLVIQSLRVSTHAIVAWSLGVSLGPMLLLMFFVFVPLLSLAMIPPITINGLGVREALGIVLFAQAGIAQADAFTIEFLTYLVSVVVSLLGFVFFVMRRS